MPEDKVRDLLEITVLLGKLKVSSNENIMLIALKKGTSYNLVYTLKQIFCSESIVFRVPEG